MAKAMIITVGAQGEQIIRTLEQLEEQRPSTIEGGKYGT